MSFLDLLKIEFIKVKRSKIVPLIFIAPLLVVVSGVANLSNYFTPEYTNAWPAMFIQSALVYAYYLLPFSMIVCVRSKESRSVINIASTAISAFWALLMVGIVALAVFLTFVQ